MQKGRILRVVIALALILAITLSLAACKPKQEEQQPEDLTQRKYTIGVNTWGSGADAFDWHGGEAVYALEVFGSTVSRVSDEFTADNTLRNVQNFISAGVDGILMTCNQAPIFPTAAEAAANAKTPFSMMIFVGDPDQRNAINGVNEYFAGAVEGDTTSDGYLMGEAAIRDGHRTAVMVGGNLGDRPIDTRVDGFTRAFEAGGGKVIDIARCNSPAEGKDKATALLSANRDVDCVYAMVGDYAHGAIGALDELGLDIPVYASHLVGNAVVEHIRNGRIVQGTAGHDLSTHLAATLLINFLDGHPVKDNGKSPDLTVKPFVVNMDNLDDFTDLFLNNSKHVLSESFLKTLTYRHNPNVTIADYNNFLKDLSVASLKALRAQYP